MNTRTADDGTPFASLSIQTNQPEGQIGIRPGDVIVRLSNGMALGCVQAVSWSAAIGEPVRCEVKTLMNPAEIKVAMQDMRLRVSLWHGFQPVKVLWTHFIHTIFWRPLWRCLPSLHPFQRAKRKHISLP